MNVLRIRLILPSAISRGEREMFYLTTHSTRLYGVRHLVKDLSDSEKPAAAT